MKQLGLFDTPPDAPTVLKFGRWGRGFPIVTVEVGQHEDGRWMWATDIYTGTYGYGYKLNPKWHNFAATRREALDKAKHEVACRMSHKDRKATAKWLEGLTASEGVSPAIPSTRHPRASAIRARSHEKTPPLPARAES